MNLQQVCAFYKFVTLDDHDLMRAPLLEVMKSSGVLGTILLAPEGVNGTISGSRESIERVLNQLQDDSRIGKLACKWSASEHAPFHRTKVKLKREIVTLGIPELKPAETAGTYVEPQDWNALISDPDVLVIDTRNNYEVGVGTFRDAVNPKTTTFRDFPAYVSENLDKDRHRKIAMFCTGGIRCEKSTAYLRQQGFPEVYHLRGGILNYLENIPTDESLWQGECFVFDERVTVDHNLEEGEYEQCHACRRPLSTRDRQSSEYRPGISCPQCTGNHSEAQLAGFSERERQVSLARQRGEAHIGSAAREIAAIRKAAKLEAKRQQHPSDVGDANCS